MSRSVRLALLLAASASIAAACFQKLDSGASKEWAPPNPDASPTVATETPEIELPEGGTTNDPCVITNIQAMEILTVNCAGCHGGGSPGARQGQPPFDYVLDLEKLKTATSQTVPDPRDASKKMRFLIPGDPDNSRLYVRVLHGEMPPPPPLGLPPIPLPTVSDISVLNTWIADCMGGSAPPPPTGGMDAGRGGAGGRAGGMGGAGGAGGTGGRGPTDGPSPPPPAPDAGMPPGTCGGAGQACCGGNTCNGGGCCVGGQCRANGQACNGAQNGSQGMCTNGSCRNAAGQPCGGASQVCCGGVGGACTAPQVRCTQGMCTACGAAGQTCCGNTQAVGTCLTGLDCQGQGQGTCQACGAAGQFCCGSGAVATQTCNGGLTCRLQGGSARCGM